MLGDAGHNDFAAQLQTRIFSSTEKLRFDFKKFKNQNSIAESRESSPSYTFQKL